MDNMNGLNPGPILRVEVGFMKLLDISPSTEDIIEFTDKNNNMNSLIKLENSKCFSYFSQHDLAQAVQVLGTPHRNVGH